MKNIQFTGFISEYHPNIANAMPYKNYFKGRCIEEKYRDKVLDYTKNGILFCPSMRAIEDLLSNKSVGSGSFYTDGKWIWPEYMIYYLKNNPNYHVEDVFIKDLVNKGFKYDKSKINERKLNFFLSKHIDGWWFAFKAFYLHRIIRKCLKRG